MQAAAVLAVPAGSTKVNRYLLHEMLVGTVSVISKMLIGTVTVTTNMLIGTVSVMINMLIGTVPVIHRPLKVGSRALCAGCKAFPEMCRYTNARQLLGQSET